MVQTIFAHYRAEDNSEATVPDCSTPEWKENQLKVCEVKKTSTSCNSFLPGLPAEPLATNYYEYLTAIDEKISENKTQIDYLKSEVPNVITNTDGGDTQSLIAYINDLSNSDGKLKNKLLASSPLSAEAILALLNRAIPLSYGNLQIVLVANSPLPDEVVEALDEITLPAGTQNVIADAQYNDPVYLTLDYIEEQISDLISDNQLLENEKVRQKIKSGDEPAAKEELEQSELIPSKKALAEELLVKEQVSESRVLINTVLTESIDISEDENFAEMMNTIADLKENGKTVQEMEQVEEDIVRQVAGSQKIVSAKAQIALELAKSEHYPHPIKKEEDSDKSLIITSENESYSTTEKQGIEFIKLYPNPNNGNMEIEYYVPDDSKCILSIYTIEGKQIVKYNLNPKNKHTFINDESLFSSGLYYYSLRVNDKIVVKDKLVIIK